jgi:CheY-like chemotaxis protein
MSQKTAIWLVDDDPIYRFAFVRIVQKLGLDLHFEPFNNGQEAWEAMVMLVEKGLNQPPLILLDINMPIMNGWDFLEEYAKLNIPAQEKSRVVMVSSSTDPRDTSKAEEFAEVAEYLSKPISEQTLLALLQPFAMR